ncbi:hypothetical protein [Serratia nematodiphila]|uniref:DUF7446 family protein n=1 Tax=Serratia nematodiphila TaxID=458197 RepID=UPI0011DA4912|nr:hypothetical protein [Serratia nematodiphila]TXE64805.1 hypothetical protein FOT58_10740 [Serratia nematodiphila]
MSKVKTMGASPLSGNIYYGTLNTEKGLWVGQKTDVTDMARRAVAEHLYHTGDSHTYELKDGRLLVLSIEIREAE